MKLDELIGITNPTTRVKIVKYNPDNPKQPIMIADDIKVDIFRILSKQNIDPSKEEVEEITTEMNVNSVMGVIKYAMVIKLC